MENEKKITKKQLSEDQLAYAHRRYLQYVPIAQIAAELNCNRLALQYHASKWKLERAATQKELLLELTQNKTGLITEIANNSLVVIKKAVEAASLEDQPSLRTAMACTRILTELDRILRLDAGDPTQITAQKLPSTRAEIIEILNKDPFHQLADKVVEEVEYQEIDDAIIDLSEIKDKK